MVIDTNDDDIQFSGMDVLDGLHKALKYGGDILVRYSRRSPHLRMNKRFLCFESIKVIAKVNSMIANCVNFMC